MHTRWNCAAEERSDWPRTRTVLRREKDDGLRKTLNTSFFSPVVHQPKGGADDLLASPWKPEEGIILLSFYFIPTPLFPAKDHCRGKPAPNRPKTPDSEWTTCLLVSLLVWRRDRVSEQGGRRRDNMFLNEQRRRRN
ncbi:hypothetical protein INR49_009509 [Caranx melampygus]|nr:hypothetical protein INR49_009509 [Caranx melampygus]